MILVSGTQPLKTVFYDHVGSVARRRTIKFKAHDSSCSVEEKEEVQVNGPVLYKMSLPGSPYL